MKQRNPAWNWIMKDNISVIVYNCPYCYNRFFKYVFRSLKMGEKFVILDSHGCPSYDIEYCGNNAITEIWKKSDREEYERGKL